MIKFGLMGGIGIGKSIVFKILKSEGIKVIDVDNIVKEVFEKNIEILELV